MKTAKQNLSEIRNGTNSIGFGETFGVAFDIYKNIALLSGIVIILIAAVLTAMTIGIFGIGAGINGFTSSMMQFNIGNFSSVAIISYLIGTAIVYGFITPITAGLIKMAHCAHLKMEFSIATAFDYFKGKLFGRLFLVGVLLSLLTGGISAAMELIGMAYIGTIFSIVVTVLTCLTIPLIIFADLSSVEAIGMSIVITGRNLVTVALLLFVGIIFAAAGFIGFCIGFFFTMPILYTIYYSIYIHAVGIEEESELEEIGSQWE